MRKKGLTLIELLIALMFLVSGVITVGIVSSASLKSLKANQIKIETTNYADTIMNILKANGKLYVKDLVYKILGDTPTNFENKTEACEFNIYFDDMAQLKAFMKNDIKPEYKAIDSNQPTIANIPISQKDKQNCAYVKISNESIGDATDNKQVNLYSILIKVWNLKNNNNNEAKFKTYIGR
jgi:hypothetical protein